MAVEAVVVPTEEKKMEVNLSMSIEEVVVEDEQVVQQEKVALEPQEKYITQMLVKMRH